MFSLLDMYITHVMIQVHVNEAAGSIWSGESWAPEHVLVRWLSAPKPWSKTGRMLRLRCSVPNSRWNLQQFSSSNLGSFFHAFPQVFASRLQVRINYFKIHFNVEEIIELWIKGVLASSSNCLISISLHPDGKNPRSIE